MNFFFDVFDLFDSKLSDLIDLKYYWIFNIILTWLIQNNFDSIDSKYFDSSDSKLVSFVEVIGERSVESDAQNLLVLAIWENK